MKMVSGEPTQLAERSRFPAGVNASECAGESEDTPSARPHKLDREFKVKSRRQHLHRDQRRAQRRHESSSMCRRATLQSQTRLRHETTAFRSKPFVATPPAAKAFVVNPPAQSLLATPPAQRFVEPFHKQPACSHAFLDTSPLPES